MASTRNKNTRNNYAQELNKSIHTHEYLMNGQYAQAPTTMYPGNGLGNAQLPSTQLASNPIEIESFLFGIGASDLTKDVPVLTPQMLSLQTRNIFIKPEVIVPPKFVASDTQRPLR